MAAYSLTHIVRLRHSFNAILAAAAGHRTVNSSAHFRSAQLDPFPGWGRAFILPTITLHLSIPFRRRHNLYFINTDQMVGWFFSWLFSCSTAIPAYHK